ncbi:hypothetical protein ABES38_08810 [Bacillus gobiensis]|uniref:hypothetical protein n=1 Tax=Bacillus gobiensis TaxID=1441095 RepID=UPI003D199FE6
MKPLNPIFESKLNKEMPSHNKSNVRKKPITKAQGRKERYDKKKDVKIPFTANERRLIKVLAKREGLDPTPYCAYLVKKGLKEKHDFPEIFYNPKGKPYPAKLEGYYYDLLFDYKINWDCSLKESAYRIISFMLRLEGRDIYEKFIQ